MVGFLLFVIPGIVLLCGVILAFPALVLEPEAPPAGRWPAPGRSPAGSRWRIFGMLVTLGLLLYVPIVALTASPPCAARRPVGVGDERRPHRARHGRGVQLFLYPLFYCVLTVSYYDLRVRKEGFDLEVLAQTLQTA
jgi:hypothetical protein